MLIFKTLKYSWM